MKEEFNVTITKEDAQILVSGLITLNLISGHVNPRREDLISKLGVIASDTENK